MFNEHSRLTDLTIPQAKELLREIVREELLSIKAQEEEKPLSVKEAAAAMGWGVTSFYRYKQRYRFEPVPGFKNKFLLSEIKASVK